MKDGFLKVGASSPEITVADCEKNADSIIGVMKAAHDMGIRLLVLPELCVTGSTCGDLFYQSALISAARQALDRIIAASEGFDMLTAVGLPAVIEGRLYSCTAFILRGRLLCLMPNKRADRHFAAAENGDMSVLVCDSFPELSIGQEGSGASVIIMPYAEPELAGAKEKRLRRAGAVSESEICAYIAAGAGNGESTTDFVFSGHDIIAENGHVLSETIYSDGIASADIDLGAVSYLRRKSRGAGYAPHFCRDTEIISFHLDEKETRLTRDFRRLPFVPDGGRQSERRSEVFTIQCRGLYKRMKHTGAKRLIVGVSGGLDSALALLVSVKTAEMLGLPESAVLAVTMPCFGTSDRTRENARQLCELLNTELRCVDISESVRRHFADIGHDEGVRDVVYENSQARERTQVLMDIANGENGLVVGTGDLSELALGWATYNGDHMSMYGVNASVPKTLIRAMIRGFADDFAKDGRIALADVLRDIADTPVSPELLPADNGSISQKTEELIGSYELNDFYLYCTLSKGYAPRKLLRVSEKTFPERKRAELIEHMKRFYKRFFSQQYKRSCLPDGPKTGTVSLSPRGDLMLPDDASAAVWLSETEAL